MLMRQRCATTVACFLALAASGASGEPLPESCDDANSLLQTVNARPERTELENEAVPFAHFAGIAPHSQEAASLLKGEVSATSFAVAVSETFSQGPLKSGLIIVGAALFVALLVAAVRAAVLYLYASPLDKQPAAEKEHRRISLASYDGARSDGDSFEIIETPRPQGKLEKTAGTGEPEDDSEDDEEPVGLARLRQSPPTSDEQAPAAVFDPRRFAQGHVRGSPRNTTRSTLASTGSRSRLGDDAGATDAGTAGAVTADAGTGDAPSVTDE